VKRKSSSISFAHKYALPYVKSEFLYPLICFTAFLFALSYMDFIVHSTLYHYGLKFSPEWAEPYWTTLSLLTITYSATVFTVYLLNKPKNKRTVLEASLLAFTAYMITLNLDLVWFMYAGGLPSLDTVWSWMPQARLLGLQWTTLDQTIFTAAVNIATAFLWMLKWRLAK